MATSPRSDGVESPQSPTPSLGSPPLEKRPSDASSSAVHSPYRHHHRTISSQRVVKETHNARAEYSTSQDDGASQRRINQYLIQEEIGRGSFGAVHFATDQYGKEYAVKEFSKSRLRKRAKSNLLKQARYQNRERFGRMSPGVQFADQSPLGEQDNSFNLIKEEIAVMKKLNHENLVCLYEVLDDPEEDSLYMVLEMCRKGVVMKMEIDELAEPKDDETCRHLFRDLLLGIEYLHAQGVIHRDIKPDNCLITADNTLKVVDFGVSEMFEKTAEMKIAKSAGSPAFMAPELCEVMKDSVDGRPADIWSMGVTLYCLKFGRVPFQKHAVWELYKSIVNDEVFIEPDCDPHLADLFTRLFEKSPVKRITMDELRAHPWVTKEGLDTLLSAEENCANPVDPPTEEEKASAITNNMGGIIAVIKAANKFKGLIRDRHPELIDSILHRASRIVQPPLPMHVQQTGSELKKDVKDVIKGTKDKISYEHPPEGGYFTGIYRETDVTQEMSRIKEQLKQHLHHPRHFTVDANMVGPDAPEGAAELSHLRQEFEHEEATHRRRSLDLEKARHEPFDERLFLNIGQGPHLEEHLDHENPEGDEEPATDYIVSESPPASELSIYELAYQQEVSKIRESGSDSTIFLTRRVKDKSIVHDTAPSNSNASTTKMTNAPTLSSPQGPRKSRLSELLGRKFQKAESKVQSAKDKVKS